MLRVVVGSVPETTFCLKENARVGRWRAVAPRQEFLCEIDGIAGQASRMATHPRTHSIVFPTPRPVGLPCRFRVGRVWWGGLRAG
jgi:hypothetical protein